ncbi:MAG: hypothetical protein WBG73_21010 [Coleofasciculaceae cyanobacterium]
MKLVAATIVSSIVLSTLPALAQAWIYMGSGSTGEPVYVSPGSIGWSDGKLLFTYRIGNEAVDAYADCGSNRWFASGYGWNSPKSEATKKMLSYVCNR